MERFENIFTVREGFYAEIGDASKSTELQRIDESFLAAKFLNLSNIDGSK